MNAARKIMFIVSVVSLLVFAVENARADWDEGDPAKWVQLPDLTTMGIDVNAYADFDATGPKMLILADDFLCRSTGPITDIHIWGSWRHDLLPLRFDPNDPALFVPDPSLASFRLSIHSDIPAVTVGGVVVEHSRPGDLLWEGFFDPGTFAVRQYADNLNEGWLDPISGNYELPGDSIVWQYNFLIDEADAFLQKGTATDPIVYWLDVSAMPLNEGPTTEEPIFGWKTSQDHWNDDAVYGPTDPVNWPSPDEWLELRHPLTDESLDMAFVITPEPTTMALLAIGGLATLVRRRR